ncbi:MAG: hypothetical protein EXR75_11865 [Myxococcales bacterium]|nr:hypothetical protein [Myxococcales bacterium]
MQKRRPPLPDDIARLIGELLGRAVTGRAALTPYPEARAAVFALYADKDGGFGAAIACDLATGAMLGAALSMVPPARVAEAVACGELDLTMIENVREVLNVGSGLFNYSGTGHQSAAQLASATMTVALTKFLTVPPEASPALFAMLKKCPGRVDVELNVAGYGAGRLTCYVV